MFESTPFNKRLCLFMRKSSGNTDCSNYSIWKFCPWNQWNALKTLLYSCGPCRSEWFPIIFWLVLFLSVLGALFSVLEFARIYCCSNYPISMWRDRKFYVLTYSMLRRARLVGAFIMINAWIMLVYGLLGFSPKHMIPWILIHILMLGFETCVWLFEVMTGRICMDLATVTTLMLSFFTILMVNCVKMVFENALRDKLDKTLRVFG